MDQPITPEPTAPPKAKLPWWAIVLIVIAILGLCACLAMFLVPIILAALGPSIGNVFSNIITTLQP